MTTCKCLYEMENGLPRTKMCFVPCEAQKRIRKEREDFLVESELILNADEATIDAYLIKHGYDPKELEKNAKELLDRLKQKLV